MAEEYPRVLDVKGCLYGQANRKEVGILRTEVEGIKGKLDKMTHALVAAALTLGTAAIMLGLNLWLK